MMVDIDLVEAGYAAPSGEREQAPSVPVTTTNQTQQKQHSSSSNTTCSRSSSDQNHLNSSNHDDVAIDLEALPPPKQQSSIDVKEEDATVDSNSEGHDHHRRHHPRPAGVKKNATLSTHSSSSSSTSPRRNVVLWSLLLLLLLVLAVGLAIGFTDFNKQPLLQEKHESNATAEGSSSLPSTNSGNTGSSTTTTTIVPTSDNTEPSTEWNPSDCFPPLPQPEDNNFMESTSFPCLVGMTGDEAKLTLEEAYPDDDEEDNSSLLEVEVLPEGSSITMDFRFDRVRIFVSNDDGMVHTAPYIG